VIGKRVRMSGTLSRAVRGLLLTTANGQVWAIETDEQDGPMPEQHVVVEGVTVATDRLRADWIGPA